MLSPSKQHCGTNDESDVIKTKYLYFIIKRNNSGRGPGCVRYSNAGFDDTREKFPARKAYSCARRKSEYLPLVKQGHHFSTARPLSLYHNVHVWPKHPCITTFKVVRDKVYFCSTAQVPHRFKMIGNPKIQDQVE